MGANHGTDKCMMKVYAFNSHFDPVRTEMTGTQHILILHVCDSDKSESKGIVTDVNSSQVCSMGKSESVSVIVHESSTDESESESVHKSINENKEQYAIDETENEEPSVTHNPVINEPSCFNLFECGKNFLKNLDAMCERACMATSKEK